MSIASLPGRNGHVLGILRRPYGYATNLRDAGSKASVVISHSCPSLPARLLPIRTFASSGRRDAREWLDRVKYANLRAAKERQVNVHQLESRRHYDPLRPLNIAFIVTGLAAGSYLGNNSDRRRRLDAGDRRGHEESFTALTRGVTVVSSGLIVEMFSSLQTIGIHWPVLTLVSAAFGYGLLRGLRLIFPPSSATEVDDGAGT